MREYWVTIPLVELVGPTAAAAATPHVLVGGNIFTSEERALEQARKAWIKEGMETILVLRLEKWKRPEIVVLMGEIPGACMTDAYTFERLVKSWYEAGVKWAIGEIESRESV